MATETAGRCVSEWLLLSAIPTYRDEERERGKFRQARECFMSQPSFFCFYGALPFWLLPGWTILETDLEKCMGLGLGSVYSEVWSGVKVMPPASMRWTGL
ncbi:hypothetical protein Pyn_05187 [Prunus yedoensis var. nudiflora]|uniref:Uncharacterized protein n=1 Tax=Prunus yedoensis var. nudiflora TaxID=2094558 RepID=A0A314U9F3_PRUYE|nr:hypothetical protein Pyn_05187 [Prunus yedoensis var. nudiflora]